MKLSWSWHTLGRWPRAFVAFLLMGWGVVITFICTSSHTLHDATLLYVVLHFLTDMMLRYCVGWGGVGWGEVG